MSAQLADPGGTDRTTSTPERILDAAEKLFARSSYAAVSIRHIAGEAGVALASANYHFGSKDGLLKAVFLRRARDLNRERARLLKTSERPDGSVPLRLILHALIAPGIEWSFDTGGRGLFMQCLIRCMVDPSSPLHEVFYKDVGHLRRFIPYFRRALPDLDEADICWRMQFTLGALHDVIVNLPRLKTISDGQCRIEDFDEVLDRMVSFADAAFRAPPWRGRPSWSDDPIASSGARA